MSGTNKKSDATDLHAELTSNSPEETIRIGKTIGELLEPGDIVALIGDLGAGKTCLVRGIAQGVGADPGVVSSPTFVLINEYAGRIPLYHFDAYRLSGADEMFELGSEEYFSGEGACLVEWADHVAETLPEEYLRLTFEIIGEQSRRLTIEGLGVRYVRLARAIIRK